ncbi:MAG: PEP/pyruvate-binding domain-containing protein, partial [Thermodesulfobacteriota bacterium]
HAVHKDVVQKLAKEQRVYLGQILAGTAFEDFLDADRENSRLKQYQVEKYLQLVDDGWILQRARYYRGAIQFEDEERWGLDFLTWLVGQDEMVRSRFFLLRQAAKDIPHKAGADLWKGVRAKSQAIAEAFPGFSRLRAKLHGQPEFGDIERVKAFRAENREKVPPEIDEMIRDLIAELEAVWQPAQLLSLKPYVSRLPGQMGVRSRLAGLIETYGKKAIRPGEAESLAEGEAREIADLLWEIRRETGAVSTPRVRLSLIDLSNELGGIIFVEASRWQPGTTGELLEKACTLAEAVAGCGYLEAWEWETAKGRACPERGSGSMSLESYLDATDCLQRIVEWGAGMVRAQYSAVTAVFGGFEPMAAGFVDDRIHSSPLLALGQVAGQLGGMGASLTGISSDVIGRRSPVEIRGMNPGFAVGQLEVVLGRPETASFASRKIYALSEAPADMKPVAGIATVSEGNLVSHVQLLARNMGIPNAVLCGQLLRSLEPYSGQEVFYAVSPRGAVRMKPAAEMTTREKRLVEGRKRKEERMAVPTERVDLNELGLLSLSTLRASDSGRICGPKAANLGQLKALFPDKVLEGLVIPFGIFRQHLDQQMPGTPSTYWHYLQEAFLQASRDREAGLPEEEIEAATLERLAHLREEIRKMEFLPEFTPQLRQGFHTEFGTEIGGRAVFIRSDTNMEDLKDFTGAGLNLTVFNVLEEEKILQAIRDVWASPFTERSYRWRQKYLLNPEDVYPSILILPSVNVDKSGVMITSGVVTSNPEDTTVAFSRGVGGAVEGQIAESYLLGPEGSRCLLSPSRETRYTVLPATGGVEKRSTCLDQPILDEHDLEQLLSMANQIRRRLPGTPGIETAGPFDVELGFQDDRIWLFQVRPYVENKQARSSAYLRSLDPKLPRNLEVPWDGEIETQEAAPPHSLETVR